jgi:tetrahydromethanopterin S-methyltransferase subunit F
MKECFMIHKVKDMQCLKGMRKWAFTGFLVGFTISILLLLTALLAAARHR